MEFLSALRGRRVLVTGATGFVGSHVVAQGVSHGVEIHALTRKPVRVPRINWWHGDLLDKEQIDRILAEVRPDAILHLAASGVACGAGSPAEPLHVNAVAFAGLLETACSQGLSPAIVAAGSGFEYAPQARPLRETDAIGPRSAYGVSKAAATMVAGLYADRLPITILRLFSLYGPGEREPRLTPYVIAQARRGAPAELTEGEQIRDYTYVGDAAEAFWRALAVPATPGRVRILNVGCGRVVAVRCFVEILADQLARRGVAADLRFGAKPHRPDECMFYGPDPRRLAETLGWLPPTRLEAGLARMVEASL